MEKRAVVLTTIVVFCFAVLFLRLFNIMLLNHQKFARRATIQQTHEIEVKKRRGIIYDRRGKEFAANIEQKSLYCDPQKVDSPSRTASQLSRFTGMDRRELLRRLKTGRRFVWIKRKIDCEKAAKIENLRIAGVDFIAEPERVYPGGKLASHIIGFVDIDNNGLAGVERSYDEQLASRGGKLRVTRDARGKILLAGDELESIGNSLMLTVDEVLQYIAEDALDEATRRWRAKSATVIMMNPYTGEILALANRPTFNPNAPGKSADSSRRNAAVTDVYEPGSTFKVVTAAAALEERLYGPQSRFDVSKGYIVVGRKVIRDVHKNDVLTFEEVIQKSSNVGIIQIAERLGKERLYEYSRRFGFGEKTGIDLPGEIPGWIRGPEQWSGTSIGAVPIGHEIAVTPLQVLRAYAAIANGGLLVTPFVVSRVISPDGRVILERQGQAGVRILSSRTSSLLREILATVTVEGGTAIEASVEGISVAGKTGTAKIFDSEKRRYSDERYISSFVGFFPADRPLIAMIVTVSEPEGEIFGGKVAAPVFKEIADKALAYLNIPMEQGTVQNVIRVSTKNEAEKYY